VTAGLKWAPEIGPKVKMIATSVAPVAIVFARAQSRRFRQKAARP
jgi:hypothetical protein